jgi:hypothetical protein
MSPWARAALAAVAALALATDGAAFAEAPALRSLDADEAPLAALALALAAVPVPQLGAAEPGREAAIPEPRVDVAVTLAARSVVFDEPPRIRVTFGRPGPPRAAWRLERRNLPARVEPGVEYRDVEVRLTLSATVDELASLVADARRVAGGLRGDDPGGPRGGADPPAQRPRASARSPMDATNAERARAGLLPRKAPPGKAAASLQAASRAADSSRGTPGSPALAQAKSRRSAAAPGGERLVDVVLAAMRSRSPADGAGRAPDTSLDGLRVRASGARIESLLVGRAGDLTVSVRTGSAGSSPGTAFAAASAPAAPAPEVGPAPVASAAIRPAPAAAQPVPAASRDPAAPVLAAAPSPPPPRAASLASAPAQAAPSRPAPPPAPPPPPRAEPSAPPPPRAQPSPARDDAGLLSRWRTARGEVMERTLDPSGRVVERQVEPPDPGWERAVDVSRLTLVSQRREEGGGVVQVVQDASGAYIEVTRDPMGRFLEARVLRR